LEKKDDKIAKVSNSEVLVIGYLAVKDFNGNYYKAYKYCKEMKIVKMLALTKYHLLGFKFNSTKNKASLLSNNSKDLE